MLLKLNCFRFQAAPGRTGWNPQPVLTRGPGLLKFRLPSANSRDRAARGHPEPVMKVRNSLKSLRGRHRNNRLVRRKGRVYVINKTQRRFKARQG